MKKLIGLFFLVLLLSGCYQSSLTYVAPATGGLTQGKISQSLVSTSVSYGVKHKTGKTPMEHILTDSQIKTVKETKTKINPCEQNLKLCSSIKTRIEKFQKELLKSNFEKTRKQLISLKTQQKFKIQK